MFQKAISLIFAVLICHAAFSQSNTSVGAAQCVLSGTHNYPVSLETSGNCIGGNLHLYYQFYTDVVPAGAVTVGSSWSVSSGTFSYTIYGPYPDLQTAHADVATGSAIAFGSSFSASSSQTIALGSNAHAGEVYIVELVLNDCSTTLTMTGISTRLVSCEPVSLTCDDCLGQFQPGEGKYVFSAWTKEEDAPVTKTSYTYPSIQLETYDGTTTLTTTFTPTGEIIDGWQQITGTFDVPAGMETLEISFIVGGSSQSALFDDVRIFPFDGSLMSYVYDPVTLRLVAELDERNYAKLYEYDEEGKLVRVKKETEKGILTIMENRENSVKKP